MSTETEPTAIPAVTTTTAGISALANALGIIGRGPGRSRPLTRDEACGAFGALLTGQALDVQAGAFLLLMRYRGETAEELAGLVDAARAHIGPPPAGAPVPALDWPSYAAGRTRGLPWYLLAARLIGAAGVPVLMHGDNDLQTGGTGAMQGLAALGLAPARDLDDAAGQLAATGFAYLPLAHLCPALKTLLDLRAVLGLRSPVNTLVRHLNPLNAPATLIGVFHPGYLDSHAAAALLLDAGRRLGVVKGAGGEGERRPFKPVDLRLVDAGTAGVEHWPALIDAATEARDTERDDPAHLAAVWRGEARDEAGEATVIGTAAVALRIAGRACSPAKAEAQARALWAARGHHP
ncbi:glycosyl transferase family protein [Tistrella sp. BH-R2-4]|uniref:Glycosyl transferase family protein n=1 Tax=Tistrella arctica TaxID=3133430 RepID=A0ABU9YII4_9PROT